MHKSFDGQLSDYYFELNEIISSVPEGKYADMLDYLSDIITPEEDRVYVINGKFLKLFVDHYHDELSELIMPECTLTHEWYYNFLYKKFVEVYSRDILGDVLQYIEELASDINALQLKK